MIYVFLRLSRFQHGQHSHTEGSDKTVLCKTRAIARNCARTNVIPYNFTFHATLTMIRSTVELLRSSCCNAPPATQISLSDPLPTAQRARQHKHAKVLHRTGGAPQRTEVAPVPTETSGTGTRALFSHEQSVGRNHTHVHLPNSPHPAKLHHENEHKNRLPWPHNHACQKLETCTSPPHYGHD